MNKTFQDVVKERLKINMEKFKKAHRIDTLKKIDLELSILYKLNQLQPKKHPKEQPKEKKK